MPCLLAAACGLLITASAQGADRYALVITGASAGEPYAQKYDAWRTSFVTALVKTFHYPDDHVMVLAETAGPGVGVATRDNVRKVLRDLSLQMDREDLLMVLLIGHGTMGDNGDAKFNLVGPDLDADEWAALLKPVPGRLVFVDSSASSFPFLRRLAAPGRVVITATDSAAQRFETAFGGFFVQAFEHPGLADADKDGRVSVWEAFSFASAQIRRLFEERGELPTERALLDDTGAGIGREAEAPGQDGTVARAVFPGERPRAGDQGAVSARLAELQRRLDDLKARRAAASDPNRYDADIERVLVEIARLQPPQAVKPE